MNTNYLRTLDTAIVKTKEDIILALTEAEVPFKKSMKKLDLMEVLLNAIETVEAQDAHDRMNVNNGTEAIEIDKEHVRSIEDIEADMRYHYMQGNSCTVDLAHDFYEAYISKAYEGHYGTIDEDGNLHPCTSFKSYINDFKGGKLFGVSYTMAMHYVNVHKHVMPHRPHIFRYFAIRVLIALVPYMRDEEKRGEVLHMVDNFSITDDMSLEEVKEVLDAEFNPHDEDVDGNEAEAEDDGEYSSSDTCDISDEALDEAVEIMEAFLECNAHDNTVTEAWYRILKKLDR